MSENLLQNGDFEAGWSEESSHRCLIFRTDGTVEDTIRGNIFTPSHWITWFRHGLPVEHDPQNSVGWAQPEVRDAWAKGDPEHGGYPGPDRAHTGRKGQLYFTFFRIHDGGFMQQVQVVPDTSLRLSAWAHAWSNAGSGEHGDDPNWSEGTDVGFNPFFALEGEIDDANAQNFTFWLGIDPTGGMNPYADTVVWGRGAHVYNAYHEVPAVEATAQGDTVTVFVRSRVLWPFKHCDAYWDDVLLEATGEEPPEPPEEPPEPPEEPPEPPEEPPEPPEEPGEWDYPVVEQGSKLGVHGIFSDDVPQHAATLAAGGTRFSVVKAVSDLSWLAQIKSISPDTITIGRIAHDLEGCEGVNYPDVDLDDLADGLMDPILEKLAQDPALRDVVDYWEVSNEPDPPTIDGYRRLAQLMIKCIERAEAEGLRAAVLGLNNGTPEWDEMVAMVETGLFGRARQGGHILTLHEGVVWSDKPIDLWWEDPIPDAPEVEGAGPLCFRYRFLYHLLQQRDEVIPLVISEWYCDRYVEDGGTAQEIVQRARWYDERFRQDYWAWGFCPFTVGPVGGWTRQDYGFAYPALVEYALSVKEGPNGLPPGEVVKTDIAFRPSRPQAEETVRVTVSSTKKHQRVALRVTDPEGRPVQAMQKPISPPPRGGAWRWTFVPPKGGAYQITFTAEGGAEKPAETEIVVKPKPGDEEGGLPREQYTRTYVLLPPGAGRRWVQAILDSGVWEKYRWTIGNSADDAGIGALTHKRVIAINPGKWPSDLEAFFRTYYPLTHYTPVEASSPHELRQKLQEIVPDFPGESEPEGEWGLPRVQYERNYVLLPPSANRAWMEAILDSEAWERRRWTVGSSADDAGIGALKKKSVIAVNPRAWGDDLAAFFRQFYPRTQYIPLEADNPSDLKRELEG